MTNLRCIIAIPPNRAGPDILDQVRRETLALQNTFIESKYITSVDKIISISEGIIKPDGNINFTVEYKASIIDLLPGKQYEMEISTFVNFGIFLNQGKIRVFIASSKLGGIYTFISPSEGKIDDQILKVGSRLIFNIVSVKIKNDTIDCIGSCPEKVEIVFDE